MSFDHSGELWRPRIIAVAEQRVYRTRLGLAFDRDAIELERRPIRRRRPRPFTKQDSNPVIL